MYFYLFISYTSLNFEKFDLKMEHERHNGS